MFADRMFADRRICLFGEFATSGDDRSMYELVDVTRTHTMPDGSRRAVLNRLSLSVDTGSLTCIVGASGSGKSTLLHLLNRMDEPDDGQIRFQGRPLPDWDVLELRRRAGLLFQNATMLPGSVRENLAAASRLRGAQLGAVEAKALLDRVGLPAAMLDQAAGSLSGGEKQRVALARLLANRPEVLLLDEATASLDPAAAEEIEELVQVLRREEGLTCIWVSHEPAQVRRVADRVVLLAGGVVAMEGAPEEFFASQSPAVRHYLTGRPASANGGADI